MTRFETLLASQILALLTACPSPPSGTDRPEPTVPSLCDTLPSEGGYVEDKLRRDDGYIGVDPGAPCPDVAKVDNLAHDECCPVHDYAGTVCGFVSKTEGQVHVSGPYGGYWTDPESAPKDSGYYSVGPIQDVCWYTGIFEVGSTCCGRPLLQDGQPVVAKVGGAGWADTRRPTVTGLSAEARRALAAYWLEAGLLEHASIASFARFTMELMAQGAPPDLVTAAQQAGLDEVHHARACFALASAYAGRPTGPAQMDLQGATSLSPTPAEMAEAVLREGCVGETLAAVDAAARLAHATDPVVRATLEQIVEDESRHAALAWSTLRWLVDQHPSIVERLARVVAEEGARVEAGLTEAVSVPHGAGAHGLLPADRRDEALRDAWVRVIEPAWAELRPGGAGLS